MNETIISDQMKIAASQNIKEKNYWVNKLSGDWVKSAFPYDHKKPPIDGRHLKIEGFCFTGSLFLKFMELSNHSDSRLHMILTAGLVTLLEKYTGNKDIIIGMPIYKQEIEGEFINTVLALRNKLEKDMTFKQLVLQVRATIMEAAHHQNYPIEILVNKLNLPESQDGFALFDAAILLENIHHKKYLGHINHNMTFSFLRTGESIEAALEYNAVLYEKTSIQRIISHFRQLFAEVFSDLNQPTAHIDILPEEEKRRILFDFNDTHSEYPPPATIHAWFEAQVEKTPGKIAVINNHRYLTYRGLNENANRLAGLLRKKGLKPEDIVGIIMEPCLEMIIGIIGILKAGGTYLPIDSEYPESRILSILGDSGASILLTRQSILKTMTFTTLKNIKESNVKPVVTPPRAQITDFDSLPFPDRTLVDYKKYHRHIGLGMAKHSISIQATRGCPYRCIYCHKIWPKNHVSRSAENLFEEIKHCYDAGVRRFSFIDDVFNLKKDNVARFMEKIIKNRLEIQLYFANGLRGDILTKEIIDLMIEAGTVDIDLALESASPRIQKLIRKNLRLEKFKENIRYIAEKYPGLILEMEMMIGFPSETEEEALMTLEFANEIKWIHFPNLNILKIYPNSDMYRLAIQKGISHERIERSANLAFHHLPETLPFSKAFIRRIQMRLLNDYFFSRERLRSVLSQQVKILTEDELVQKYDSYLPMEIRAFPDILNAAGIEPKELGPLEFLPHHHMHAPGFRENMKKYFPNPPPEDNDALRVLLLDLSAFFSSQSENLLSHMVEEPLGLIYLLTYLKKTFNRKICGKIGKSGTDFDSFDQLKTFIRDFKPDLIGFRTLSYYKEFFHRSISLIRQWGINVPIITGGPYATSDYQSVLSDPHINIVVLGEGELTFAHLIEKIIENGKKLPGDDVLKSIPGLAFIKKQDKTAIKKNSREVLFMDNIREMTAAYPRKNPDHVNRPTDLLYLISTSGSTGKPKSLMMEHRNLANLMNFQLKETTVDFKRVLQFASIGFDVSSQEIFSALLAGGELYLIDIDTKRDAYRLLEWMEKNHINVIYWPPAFLKYIFSEAEYRVRFPKSVRHIITAGEPLMVTEPILQHLKENQVYLHNHYGPAETHVVTTFVAEPTANIPEFPPIGKSIANTRISILDENKRPKPIGAIGELYIAGANVGRGYSNQPQLTAENFIEQVTGAGDRCRWEKGVSNKKFLRGGPGGAVFTKRAPLGRRRQNIYRTGDLARWLPDGNIEFIGRGDHQVKIRGFRVELEEIQNRLMEIDYIKDALVIDLKDSATEKFLCAYIVSEKNNDISGLKNILSHHLPDYMIPAYFMRLEKIPVTPNGKVDKKALPFPEIKRDEEYIAPRDNVEKELAGIWSEILKIDKDAISIDANFFELGGHSLRATILITRIRQAFHIKLSLAEVFTQPTIRGLSQYIKEAEYDSFISIEPAEKKEYYPLSSAQKRIYILQGLQTENVMYNTPTILVLEGELGIKKFEETMRQLIKRHETLSTGFDMIEEKPVQKIYHHDEMAFAIEYREMTEEEAIKNAQEFTRPFDLTRPPLLRLELLKIEETRYVLLYDMHHIINDGTSQLVFQREFMALYGGKQLPPLRIQYKDFSGWQNKLFESGRINKQLEYWKKQLHGEIPVLNIPTDYSRPRVQSFAGSSLRFGLGPVVTRALNDLVMRENVTLYILLLSIFNVLLAKISNQEDIIVGSPIAARRHADLHFVIGMFVNTLVMRNYPAGSKTSREFLEEVKTNTLQAFENQDYPFEELVDQVEINRDASRNPLFDVVFALQNMVIQSGSIPEVNIPQLRMTPIKQHKQAQGTPDKQESHTQDKQGSRSGSAKFDLTLYAIETQDHLNFIFEYSTRLFKRETIQRFIRYFKEVLFSILNDTGKKISDLEIMSTKEKQQVLFDFNNTTVDYPGEKTTHQLFESQVEKTPNNIAISFKDLNLTYKELNERANRLADLLISRGVRPNMPVGLMLERSIEMIAGIIGILKAGGAYLPIEPDFPRKRILSTLADSSTFILLTHEKYAGKPVFTSLQNLKPGNVKAVITPGRTPIKNFDRLPLPDRTLIEYKAYHQHIGNAPAGNTITIQSTRGCPFNCMFCHKIWPKQHAVRSAENVFEEIHRSYQAGIKRFVFLDDIFNLDVKNSTRLLQKIIKNRLQVQLFFPNGLRGDIMTKDYIDLLAEAGTVNFSVALETASPRIQQMIRKHLNIEKFQENIDYITKNYPQIILEMELMFGFPTETEEEALLTLDFLKKLQWVHFPNLNILKIYPNTDMSRIAINNGIPEELIERSSNLAFHELPETLPFAKEFALQYQTRYMSEYFLSKERLIHVLPFQIKALTEKEIIKKYDSYLPVSINRFTDILDTSGIKKEELGEVAFLPDDFMAAPGYTEKIKKSFPIQEKTSDAFRILLLDLSQLFSKEAQGMLYDVIEAPLGLMYLLTYLNKELNRKINGKIAKSRIDFDRYDQLKNLLDNFKPQLIGIRTLSFYKEFFHKTISLIKYWYPDIPIITGGPYSTTDYQTVLSDKNVDVVVLGEGERTFSELIVKIIDNKGKLPADNVLAQIAGIGFVPGQLKLDNTSREVLMLDRIIREKTPGYSSSPGKPNFYIHQPDNLAYLLYTSGSTGKPKGIAMPHHPLCNLIKWQIQQETFAKNTITLQFTPFSFDVSFQEIFSTLASGGKLVVIEKEMRRDVLALLDFLEKESIERLFLPFIALQQLARTAADIERFPSNLREIYTAGEQLRITPQVACFFEILKNCQLHNHYGPTESHVVTAFTLQGPVDHWPTLPPIGHPLANSRIYILDRHLKPTPVGVSGELAIGGETLARGYLNRPELTAEKFCLRQVRGADSLLRGALSAKGDRCRSQVQVELTKTSLATKPSLIGSPRRGAPGPRKNFLLSPFPRLPYLPIYRTGDLARWLPDENLEFIGRIDHQVKIRGFRIEPGEIESCLFNHNKIKDAVVIAKSEPGQEEDNYLTAYIIADNKFSVSQLREYLSKQLPEYMIPAYFVQIDKIPLTSSGKVDRNVLPLPLSETITGEYSPPRDKLEEKLAEMWSKVLEIKKESISIHANFFQLGGHSLKATVLVSKIRHEFNLVVPLMEIFKTPTIQSLAKYIKKALTETTGTPGSAGIITPQDDNLVLLKPAEDNAQNLFLVHDGTGEVEGYLEFCKHISTQFNCWGLRAQPLENLTPQNWTIEDLSQQYIQRIKKIQARGPYFIAGWSLGGTIAFEMTRQLEQQKEKIVLLALVDSPPPPSSTRKTISPFNLESELKIVKAYAPNSEIEDKLKNVTRLSQFWLSVVKYLDAGHYDIEPIKKAITRYGIHTLPNYHQLDTRESIYYLNIGRTLHQAWAGYIPTGKVSAAIHFFKADESRFEHQSWNNYCQNPMTLHEIDGNHFSLFQLPRVIPFARIFTRIIKKTKFEDLKKKEIKGKDRLGQLGYK